ncbi:hypothetical protein B296_00041999 [Ensete ventricosum]|uniref:Uncharacterized protein n=1 Tax=Ensete ventricosum TaxID=4639 RepID=A0A426WYG8_ENSVE|nr:hypothetical protein B296_00041999 [Ensete ventricosum]
MGGQPQPGLLQGRPTMAWPPARGRPTVAKAHCKGVIGCGEGPLHRGRPACRADKRLLAWPLIARHPQGQPATGATGCRLAPARGGHQRPARKGLLAHDEVIGAAPTNGQLAEGWLPPPA